MGRAVGVRIAERGGVRPHGTLRTHKCLGGLTAEATHMNTELVFMLAADWSQKGMSCRAVGAATRSVVPGL